MLSTECRVHGLQEKASKLYLVHVVYLVLNTSMYHLIISLDCTGATERIAWRVEKEALLDGGCAVDLLTPQ